MKPILRRSPVSPTARSALHSVATGVIGQGAVLVSGILVARLLGPELRGYVALLVLFPSFLSIVGGLGVPEALTYFIARDPHASRAILRSVLHLGLVQALVLCVIHALLLWLTIRDYPAAVRVAGLISLMWVPAALAIQYGFAVIQGHRRYKTLNRRRLLAPTLYSMAIIPVFTFGIDDVRVIISLWVTAYSIAAVATVTAAVLPLPASVDTVPVPGSGDMIRFGLKSFVGSTSPVETFGVDQAIIGLFLSARSLGLYVAAISFTNLPRLIGRSVGLVAYPHVAAMRDMQEAKRSIWRLFWFTVVLCTAIVTLLGVVATRLVPLLFGDAFRESVPLVRVLLIGALFFGARRVLGDGLRGAGYPMANTIAEVCSWAWLIPSLAVLAPRWGTGGVAVALTSASLVGLVVLVFIAHRTFSRRSREAGDVLGVPSKRVAVPPRTISAAKPTEALPGAEELSGG